MLEHVRVMGTGVSDAIIASTHEQVNQEIGCTHKNVTLSDMPCAKFYLNLTKTEKLEVLHLKIFQSRH